jgi:hypothetical protein
LASGELATKLGLISLGADPLAQESFASDRRFEPLHQGESPFDLTTLEWYASL